MNSPQQRKIDPDNQETNGYRMFVGKFTGLSGIDLSNYKSTQMVRRVQAYFVNKGMSTYTEFVKRLESDPKMLLEFKNYLTINVTSFFRDVDKWDALKDQHLPEIVKQSKVLKVWSAGCSTGCESYTLAILLSEFAKKARVTFHVSATDIDHEALETAKKGVYGPDALKTVPKPLMQHYFDPAPDGKFAVKPALTKLVSFRHHDMLKDRFEGNFDLVVCRNVIIYFDEPVKARLFVKFAGALRPGGILFIGGSELIFKSETMGLAASGMCFYRKS